MRPDHRAQLAAAVARFQADIRRLVRTVPRQERDRLLARLDPTRVRPAATRRTRKRVKSTVAEAIATPVIATQAGAEARTEPGVAKPAVAEPSTSATAAPRTHDTTTAGRADSTAVPGKPASATGRGKRVRWTREAIINELASWMLSGTAIDASFVKRHGPPGLVPAALRVFGRFDAALNVAGLHVARLYPAGPPGS